MVWHQLWSSSTVVDDDVDAGRAGRPALTVTRAVRAPAARAAASARFVAHVPPSWETPMHESAGRVQRQPRTPGRATGAAVRAGRPRAAPRAGSRRPPSAPCSLVPQPTSDRARRAAAARAAASASRAAGPSDGQPGEAALGEGRLGRDHLGHVPRRRAAVDGLLGPVPGLGRPGRGRSGSNRGSNGSLMAPRIGWPHTAPERIRPARRTGARGRTTTRGPGTGLASRTRAR